MDVRLPSATGATPATQNKAGCDIEQDKAGGGGGGTEATQNTESKQGPLTTLLRRKHAKHVATERYQQTKH